MQEGFSMILLAVVNGQPREMGLIQAIKHFIDHRVEVVRRRTAYLLQKAKDREHILEGYLNALDHLDNVITIIRASANRADARENLVAYFGGKKIDINTTGRAPKLDPEKPFTARQADAILELQLHRLTKLSIDEISNELKEVREQHRRVRIHPRLREQASQSHHQRTRRSQRSSTETSAAPASKTKPPKSFSKI